MTNLTSAGSILPPSFVDLLSDLGCAVFRPELMTEIALLDANVGDNLFGFFRHLIKEVVHAGQASERERERRGSTNFSLEG